MKLLSLYIDNFGKLSDFRMEFSDGVNSILADNGYGKTTLAAFIKAMLYGLPKSTKKNLSENERKHYIPWNGGAFGGYLDIETRKGRYRIERSFGKKEADDTFKLKNLTTGLVSNDYSENVGLDIFGIDMSSYEKSIYLPQRAVEISMTSDIGAKLNKMLESSADMADCDSAVRRLDDYVRALRFKKGSGGVINDLQTKLSKLEAQAEKCREALSLAEKEREELSVLRGEIKACRDEEESMKDETGRANEAALKVEEFRTYLEYVKDAETSKERADELRELFPGQTLPKKEELLAASQLCRRLDRAENADPPSLTPSEQTVLETHIMRFGDELPDESELKAYSDEISQLREKQSAHLKRELPMKPSFVEGKLPSRKILIIFAVVFGALCVAMSALQIALNNPAFVAAAGISAFSAVCLVGSWFITTSKDKENLKNDRLHYEKQLEQYESQLRELADESNRLENESAKLEEKLSVYYPSCPGGLDACLSRLYSDCESFRNLKEAQKRVELLQKKRDDEISLMKETLFAFFEKYQVSEEDPEQAISEISRRIAELSARTDEWLTKRRRAAEFARERNIDPDNPPVVPDTTELRRTASELHERINSLCAQEGSRLARIESLESQADALAELMHESDRLRIQIDEAEEKYSDAKSAIQYLEEARDGLSSRYIRQMETSFSNNFARFERGISDPELDVKLGVSFRDGGHSRDPEWYSEGTQSLIYLCLRLSLIDALFEDETPFIILDDPFSELDDTMLEKSKEIVKELSSERQIIYLTCYSRRKIR